MAGISREHLSRIEAGKVALTEDMKHKLLEAVEKFNPEAPQGSPRRSEILTTVLW